MSARLLVEVLRDPSRALALNGAQWNGLIAAARAERLIGTLAFRLSGLDVPAAVRAVLDDARFDAARETQQALWEADRMRAALDPLGVPVVLLKGTAYVAAELRAGEGRFIGDLDILVPRASLPQVEEALLAAGWEWVKPDPYDDAYYREWMHELPPLIHAERNRMIDVHHTILPLTARPTPYIGEFIEQRRELDTGQSVLCPEHMVIHAVAHLLADGDLTGGLRNLWDIDRLCREFGDKQDDFYLSLHEEAWAHGLYRHVSLGLRLANRIFGTPIKAYHFPITISYRPKLTDRLFVRRLLSSDDWGRDARKLTGFAFYLRSHLLRMPPMMLARHLLTKWRKGYRPVS